MKKHFLALLSWSLLFAGAASFVSCEEDDDEQSTALYEKYKNKSGVSVDGDNIVYVSKVTSYTQVQVFHFSDDKIDKATGYIDYGNESTAKDAYNQAKKNSALSNVQINGNVVSYTMDKSEYEEFADISKEGLLEYFKMH